MADLTRAEYEAEIQASQQQLNAEVTTAQEGHQSRIDALDAQWRASANFDG